MKKITPVLALTLLALSCSSAFAAKPATPAKAIPVRSELVSEQPLTPTLAVVGYLAAEKAIMVAPQVSGKIAEIMVQANQQVSQGQPLLRIEDASASADLLEANAYLADEQRKLAELKRLISKGAVTQSEIDAQQASVAMAQARVDRAQAQRDYHHLNAPFAGTVGLIDHSVGALVSSGSELMSLDDLSTLRLDLSIPERYLAQLRPGLQVVATSRSWPNQQFTGTVVAIDPRISQQSLNLQIRVQFDNPEQRLKPGMMLAANIEFAPLQQTFVPVQALEYFGTKRFVYVLDDNNRVHRTEVTLGERVGTNVAINSGVKAGQRIVVEGTVNMKDGVKVADLSKPSSKQGVANAAF
ncbi:efflux RND transporter periplasmic adaptor subunit [Ferrimonas senticii]|uniref:efflux RND transporter periplasmic adaptor subunit n=1 Tax=Ferrimonas senticii TaxID=394566 RepID=UPI0004885535|nr:efflux RND transporter periplasmic adaptor subunit [Ferrimonas senticii]